MTITAEKTPNTKLTQYKGIKELVLKNNVKNVPFSNKSKCDAWNGQLINYF